MGTHSHFAFLGSVLSPDSAAAWMRMGLPYISLKAYLLCGRPASNSAAAASGGNTNVICTRFIKQYNTIQDNTIHLYDLFPEMCLQWDKNNLPTHLHTGLHTHTYKLELNNYNNSAVLEHEVRRIIEA